MQTIKLNSLDRWQPATEKTLAFDGEGARRVRLHVNSPGTALAWIQRKGADIQFLARVEGYQVIEFYAEGAFDISIDGADVWWMCAESEPTHVNVIDPQIFTKIANRRHRNPELEEVMYRMQQNVERRLAQQAVEMEAAFERRRREEIEGRAAEIVRTDAPGAAANSGAGEVPEAQPGTPPTVEGTGVEAGGEQPSDNG